MLAFNRTWKIFNYNLSGVHCSIVEKWKRNELSFKNLILIWVYQLFIYWTGIAELPRFAKD